MGSHLTTSITFLKMLCTRNMLAAGKRQDTLNQKDKFGRSSDVSTAHCRKRHVCFPRPRVALGSTWDVWLPRDRWSPPSSYLNVLMAVRLFIYDIFASVIWRLISCSRTSAPDCSWEIPSDNTGRAHQASVQNSTVLECVHKSVWMFRKRREQTKQRGSLVLIRVL